MTYEALELRIKEIIDQHLYVDKDGGIEIYCDYTDELSDETIKEILSHNNPMDAFYDVLSEWAIDYEIDYGRNEIEIEIKKYLSEEELECWEENEMGVWEYLQANCYFYYPADHFNKNVEVNIMLDVGNADYDFVKDHVLDWYGTYMDSSKGNFENGSSILWLAKQQKKATKLREQVKRVYNGELVSVKDKFVDSVIQELENSCSWCTGLTFLVSMPLFDLFKLMEAIKSEEKINKTSCLEQRRGTGYIVFDKSVMCGLYDPWNGSGSVFGIECDKDVKIPIRAIFDAWVDGTKEHGYDVGDVYGMCSSAWRECLKETHYMTDEEIAKLENNVA